VDAIVAHYLAEAGRAVALEFVEALDRALRHIGEHPAAGSPRYAHELDLPGLRVWPVRRFPYLVFYVEGAEEIDVWRILHGRSDIPAWLRPPAPEDG
jgi:toxin ParE1/3/4